jgi:hypothetical protein
VCGAIQRVQRASVQDAEIIWGGEEGAQITYIRSLYDAMIKELNLGDFDLGYRRLVEQEDGLSALLTLCGVSGKVPPARAWATLLLTIKNRDGSLNFTRVAHVLTRLAMMCACQPL